MVPQRLGPRPPQVLALGPGTCSSDVHGHLQRPSRWVLGEEPACISSWREGVRPPPQVLSSSGSGAPCHLCRVGEGPILTSRSVCPCRLQAAWRQPCCSQPWEMGPSLHRKDAELKAGPENPRSRRNVPGLVLPTCPLAHAGSHRHPRYLLCILVHPSPAELGKEDIPPEGPFPAPQSPACRNCIPCHGVRASRCCSILECSLLYHELRESPAILSHPRDQEPGEPGEWAACDFLEEVCYPPRGFNCFGVLPYHMAVGM